MEEPTSPAPAWDDFTSGTAVAAQVPSPVVIDAKEYDRLREIERRVREMVTQRTDAICWRDAYTELAKLVGVDFCPELIEPPERMLANCCHFVESLRTGGKYTPVYVERSKEQQ